MRDDLPPLRDRLIEAIKTVRDPEIPVNIYDLGLIYDIAVAEDAAVTVRMTLTTPNCPVAEALPEQVRQAAGGVAGVGEVTVELVWEPPWTAERMSESAKLELATMGMDYLAAAKTPFIKTDHVFGKRR
jgi:FeS assembly SUF system protein